VGGKGAFLGGGALFRSRTKLPMGGVFRLVFTSEGSFKMKGFCWGLCSLKYGGGEQEKKRIMPSAGISLGLLFKLEGVGMIYLLDNQAVVLLCVPAF